MHCAKRGAPQQKVLKDTSSRVFENRVLTKIGSKREELTDDCSKLDDAVYTKCYLGGKIEKDEMGGACGTNGAEYVNSFGRET